MSENKYHAQTVTYYHKTFKSKKEGERWLVLLDKAHRGEIYELRTQVKYELVPAAPAVKLRDLSYVADFVYKTRDGKTVVEDVKGYKKGAPYKLFKAKQKLMYHRFGIYVREL